MAATEGEKGRGKEADQTVQSFPLSLSLGQLMPSSGQKYHHIFGGFALV